MFVSQRNQLFPCPLRLATLSDHSTATHRYDQRLIYYSNTDSIGQQVLPLANLLCTLISAFLCPLPSLTVLYLRWDHTNHMPLCIEQPLLPFSHLSVENRG